MPNWVFMSIGLLIGEVPREVGLFCLAPVFFEFILWSCSSYPVCFHSFFKLYIKVITFNIGIQLKTANNFNHILIVNNFNHILIVNIKWLNRKYNNKPFKIIRIVCFFSAIIISGPIWNRFYLLETYLFSSLTHSFEITKLGRFSSSKGLGFSIWTCKPRLLPFCLDSLTILIAFLSRTTSMYFTVSFIVCSHLLLLRNLFLI